MCCILILYFVKWRNGVKEIGSWDLYGSEDFEKKEANGLKKVKLDRSNPLETSTMFMMKDVVLDRV
jgi:hypothetical protein